MNELLPIIRRARRPLVAVEVPPVVVGNVEPVEVVMPPVPTETVVPEPEPEANDAKAPVKRNTQ